MRQWANRGRGSKAGAPWRGAPRVPLWGVGGVGQVERGWAGEPARSGAEPAVDTGAPCHFDSASHSRRARGTPHRALSRVMLPPHARVRRCAGPARSGRARARGRGWQVPPVTPGGRTLMVQPGCLSGLVSLSRSSTSRTSCTRVAGGACARSSAMKRSCVRLVVGSSVGWVVGS